MNGLSQATIKNLEFIINGLKEYLKGKPFKETTEQDVLGFLIHKKEHGASPGSQRAYSIAIKAFYRFLYDLPLHQYPRQVLNLRNGNHTRKLPIKPEDVITKKEVAHLVKHCTNYRNEV